MSANNTMRTKNKESESYDSYIASLDMLDIYDAVESHAVSLVTKPEEVEDNDKDDAGECKVERGNFFAI